MTTEARVSPYFSKEQIKIIDGLVNKIGCSRADVVKQLTLIKLTDMGYFNHPEKIHK